MAKITKYAEIEAEITQLIKSGNIDVGQQLKPRQLQEQYKVSSITIERVLRNLLENGYIKRAKGIGSTVISQYGTAIQKVYLIFPHRAELWSDIFAGVLHELTLNNYDIRTYELDSLTDQQWIDILKDTQSVIVTMANKFFPFHLLKAVQPLPHLIFAVFFESTTKYPASYILYDNYRMGALAAQELIQNNCKNILYYGINPKDSANNQEDRICGIKDVLASSNTSLTVTYYNKEDETNTPLIADMIKTHIYKNDPGIICTYDYQAHQIYKALQTLNIGVPKQVKVIGAFNSQWSKLLIPSLTSIDSQAPLFVSEILRLIQNPVEIEIKISPKLISRESTQSQVTNNKVNN